MMMMKKKRKKMIKKKEKKETGKKKEEKKQRVVRGEMKDQRQPGPGFIEVCARSSHSCFKVG